MEINPALKRRVVWYREKRARRFGVEALATITLLALTVFVSKNLNKLPDMQSIDDANQRKAGKTADGKSLADGLLYHSQQREAYVQDVKLMLDHYHQFQLETSG